MTDFTTLFSPAGESIAWINDGAAPAEEGPCGLFWLGGFMSDMAGSKATSLGEIARLTGRSAVRFDYSGHGESSGEFRLGTIGKWLDEAEAVFRQVAKGPRVIVGSSMGGWIALALARRLMREAPEEARRIRGMVLLAPAADMTKDLMWDKLTPEAKREMKEKGFLETPSDYDDEPYIITRELIEEGEKHLLLEQGLEVSCPVRILHGEADADVPWEHGLKVYHALSGEDVTFTLVKGGDHRLSTPRDLRLLQEIVLALCARADHPA